MCIRNTQTEPLWCNFISFILPMDHLYYQRIKGNGDWHENVDYYISVGLEYNSIWVRSRRCGCLVTWFCYHLIAKPVNKTVAPSWPDPDIRKSLFWRTCIKVPTLSPVEGSPPFLTAPPLWNTRGRMCLNNNALIATYSSVTPGRCGSNFKSIISEYILLIKVH